MTERTVAVYPIANIGNAKCPKCLAISFKQKMSDGSIKHNCLCGYDFMTGKVTKKEVDKVEKTAVKKEVAKQIKGLKKNSKKK